MINVKKGANDPPPPYHRLNIDLEPSVYKVLKQLAESEERSPSGQAKVMLLRLLKNKIHERT